MNILILTNGDMIIRGNTVLAPNQVPDRNREIEKQQIIKKKNIKNRKIKEQAFVIRNIFIVFLVGLALIGRCCSIYNMQKQLNTIQSNISDLNKDNDNLKVELVKYNNVQYIEEVATNKLHMVTPDMNNAIYANISKGTIIPTSSSKSDSNDSFISKVVSKIF